jgi:hypothetical protein
VTLGQSPQVSDRSSFSLKQSLTANFKEWHEIDPRNDVLSWVARLSSRIFNGERLTSNPEWLRISKEFTVSIFTAVTICKMVPPPFRWFAERVLPICRKVRSDRRKGAKLLAPILAERAAEIAAAKKEGRAPNLPDDSIEWLRNSAKGRKYDVSMLQLGLAMAAIHTTSDLLGQALLNLGAHPEMIEPMRNEAIEVLRTHGWSKVALTELRIMDSFFKETQRMKPISMCTYLNHKAKLELIESNSINAPPCNQRRRTSQRSKNLQRRENRHLFPSHVVRSRL